MLTDIINQIQQERNQDRHMSKKTGTNQIHDFTRIPGHRKVGPNTILGRVSAFAPVLPPAPVPAPAPEPKREVVIPEPVSTQEPVSEPAPIETVVQQQQPTRLSKAAMKRKQKEEELARKREAQAQAEAPAPTPEPIEIESTVSE